MTIASCSKSNNEPEQFKNEITINGAVYPTVAIGTRTWTTVNYNGNGGVNYNDGANDPTFGKLYSFQEVKAITGLPIGWRVPTEADVKVLMATVGTKLDGADLYTDATASQKFMSKAGWSNALLTGNNSTGLNLVSTGDCFVSSATIKNYSGKGIMASFWTSTTIKSPVGINNGVITYSYDPLLFEVSTNSYDDHDEPAGLRGAIYDTTASFDGITAFPAEKRSIRFVRDN
ncbi:FISUMP domain-containing protein [Pedobacter gandavensis]|uniref:FISUMP domain-containing protein n=1 Tax=Pedobacter gandavensis TaxID=2679963 RepID=UPI0016011440|nr:FISUMP domain-containing protein [Pedobacter gandavensis]